MAASMISIDNKTRYAQFAIDTAEDISLLPTTKAAGKDNLSTVVNCLQGSIARVINEDGVYYQLDSTDVWHKKTTGGGGGVLPPDYSWADSRDIDNLFP